MISRSIRQIVMASLGSTVILSSVLVSGTAAAATVAVSPGNSLYLTVTSSGNNNSVNPGTGTFSGLSGGGYTYANGFSSQQTTNFGSTGYGFYDDYVISIGAGQVDSISSSITLGNLSGITGFSVRLYNYAANGDVAPLTGPPALNSVLDAWSTTIPLGGSNSATYAVLAPQNLTAGTYVVEVRGTASGLAGGTYSGNLNLTPVPLPAAFSLLLSGLGLVGFGRRRRAAAAA
ncbi:MAG: FxDxF family PEP-CTERM protein [Steroidobacteraceae bacterium]